MPFFKIIIVLEVFDSIKILFNFILTINLNPASHCFELLKVILVVMRLFVVDIHAIRVIIGGQGVGSNLLGFNSGSSVFVGLFLKHLAFLRYSLEIFLKPFAWENQVYIEIIQCGFFFIKMETNKTLRRLVVQRHQIHKDLQLLIWKMLFVLELPLSFIFLKILQMLISLCLNHKSFHS